MYPDNKGFKEIGSFSKPTLIQFHPRQIEQCGATRRPPKEKRQRRQARKTLRLTRKKTKKKHHSLILSLIPTSCLLSPLQLQFLYTEMSTFATWQLLVPVRRSLICSRSWIRAETYGHRSKGPWKEFYIKQPFGLLSTNRAKDRES